MSVNKRKIMIKSISFVLSILCMCIIWPLSGQQIKSTPTQNPAELGKINWLRDYDTALAQAKDQDKPILILFQEVPGCSTCSKFGFGPLSDPFIVEAIEDNFIPLAIHNNKKGADADVLKKFNEPAWNNPVVRIIKSNERDLVGRMANRWSPSDLLATVIKGIEKLGKDVPAYLTLHQQELNGQDNIKEANLAMFCFWTGEKEISKIEGVLSTEAGHMHGKEVVKVVYDANHVTLPTLVNQAAKAKCADAVFVEDDYDIAQLRKATEISSIKRAGSYQMDKEVKYYMSKSDYRFVPMSPLQAAKVNAAIGGNENPDRFLSPRQLLVKDFIDKHSTLKWASQINQDMGATWYALLDRVVAGR